MTRFWERAKHKVNIQWKFASGDRLTLIAKTAAPQDLS
jgi:hypothetical protein